jgi:Icc-related predicted phosphoesterase
MAIKIAAVGDIHVGRSSFVTYTQLFEEIAKKADILMMCGDLTHNGLPQEAEQLSKQLSSIRIPKLAVLGNHDHHQHKQTEIKQILRSGGIIFVDDEPYQHTTIGFTGVKGFGGGFGSHTLGMFGEEEMKDFAREAIAQAEALEVNLEELEHEKVAKKIVLLHYSPIVETIKGEPLEIYPFLGTSRLEEVIDRFRVSYVFHGHAHFGSAMGNTRTGVPVYNVSIPVREKISQEYPFLIIEA